jgi:hypothetical protein
LGEAFQPHGAEGGQEVVVQVVAVADYGGRLESACFGVEPAHQIFGDGLGVVEVDACAFAFQYLGQGGASVGSGVVAAAAHGFAPLAG